jgi:hypothetical protein
MAVRDAGGLIAPLSRHFLVAQIAGRAKSPVSPAEEGRDRDNCAHLPRPPKLIASAASAAFAALFAGLGQPRLVTTSLPTGTMPRMMATRIIPPMAVMATGAMARPRRDPRAVTWLFPSTNWPPSMRYYSQ